MLSMEGSPASLAYVDQLLAMLTIPSPLRSSLQARLSYHRQLAVLSPQKIKLAPAASFNYL
jgi:hypothetical protein